MTPLGKLIFSGIGLLFLAGIALMVRLALRGTDAVRPKLSEKGWTVNDGPSAGDWTASRTKNGLTTNVAVSHSGVRQRSVWTSLKVSADTAQDDVLVTAKLPGFLAPDGVIAEAFGFKAPPGYAGGSPEFRAAYDVYASDSQAAERWLSGRVERAFLDYARSYGRGPSVRVFGGSIEARWAQSPASSQQVEDAAGLIEIIRARE